jgi:hypothetical protein
MVLYAEVGWVCGDSAAVIHLILAAMTPSNKFIITI